jgi:hypothetical protein
MARAIMVLKADGTVEEFRVDKLRNSLRRAGASLEEVTDIVKRIESRLFDSIKTEVIYREAFAMLRESERSIAARYSLRRAMVGLGPTGFPFEDYLSRLFSHMGYATKTRQEIKGRCVSHEVDMIAYRGDECIAAEAKFHMQPGTKSDLQVVLYSYARFLDIQGTRPLRGKAPAITRSMIVTNTKFTTTAIRYARCAGVDLLSWDYPRKGNLQQIIESSKLYPITVLPSLSVRHKQELLRNGAVLCSDIIDNHALLRSAGVPSRSIPAVIEEGARLCKIA